MLKKGILARYCEKRKKKDNTYANFRILSRLLITFWKFYNMKSLKFFYPNYLIQYKYHKSQSDWNMSQMFWDMFKDSPLAGELWQLLSIIKLKLSIYKFLRKSLREKKEKIKIMNFRNYTGNKQKKQEKN